MTGNTTTQREVRLAVSTVGTELARLTGSVIPPVTVAIASLSRRGVERNARHCRRIAARPCSTRRRDVGGVQHQLPVLCFEDLTAGEPSSVCGLPIRDTAVDSLRYDLSARGALAPDAKILRGR